MRHRLLFQNEYFTIEYNAIDNWLKIVWADRQNTESIQQGYEKARNISMPKIHLASSMTKVK